MFVLITGYASAIRPTSALYDQTGISTTIDATSIGTFLVDHDMGWQQTDTAGADLANTSLTEGETRAIFTYRENTLGADGNTRYTKDYDMDGSNVSAGRDNLEVIHTVNFNQTPGKDGQLWFDEEGTISVSGAASNSTDTRCVFASSGSGQGAFQGTVTAGSVMNVDEVAAVTQLDGRAISGDSSVPVNLRYGFDAEGSNADTNDTLASGSAAVFMNTDFVTGDPVCSEDCCNETNVSTRIYDNQRTVASGLFGLAQTHEYTSSN
ncbi:MAG: hypothetical protein LUQ07_05010 [Methanospirillum sp.]|nr:hypothetical protein [Methanospirillum sp.]